MAESVCRAFASARHLGEHSVLSGDSGKMIRPQTVQGTGRRLCVLMYIGRPHIMQGIA